MANKQYIKFSLNIDMPYEKQMYEHIKRKENISGYIKKLISEDISSGTKQELLLSEIKNTITQTIKETLETIQTDADDKETSKQTSAIDDANNLNNFIFGPDRY